MSLFVYVSPAMLCTCCYRRSLLSLNLTSLKGYKTNISPDECYHNCWNRYFLLLYFKNCFTKIFLTWHFKQLLKNVNRERTTQKGLAMRAEWYGTWLNCFKPLLLFIIASVFRFSAQTTSPKRFPLTTIAYRTHNNNNTTRGTGCIKNCEFSERNVASPIIKIKNLIIVFIFFFFLLT